MRKRSRQLAALAAPITLVSMLAIAGGGEPLRGWWDLGDRTVQGSILATAGTFCDPGDKNVYCWDPQPGATEYQVVRSAMPDFLSDCVQVKTADTQWLDAEVPPSKAVFYYLDRVSAPTAGDWGNDSSGQPRQVACVGGDGTSCDAPILVVVPAGGVFSDSRNSCGAPAQVFDYFTPGCQTFDYPGPELIYEITLGEPNEVQIKLKPVAPTDMGLFLLSDCSDPMSCITYADEIGGGQESWIAPGQTVMVPGIAEPRTYPSVGAGTYWVYVDSYYDTPPKSCGDYTLEVGGTVGAVLLDFTVE